LLVLCYGLAAGWPGPGLSLRELAFGGGTQAAGPAVTLPLILLAILLFCAAVATDLTQIRAVASRPSTVLFALVGVWVAPAVFLTLISLTFPNLSAGLLLGLALVAAMPVANSSVGWAQHAGGNLALSLCLIVLSIGLSPWVTPQLIRLFGLSLSETQRVYSDALVARFSGQFFIVWVVVPPSAVGDSLTCEVRPQPH